MAGGAKPLWSVVGMALVLAGDLRKSRGEGFPHPASQRLGNGDLKLPRAHSFTNNTQLIWGEWAPRTLLLELTQALSGISITRYKGGFGAVVFVLSAMLGLNVRNGMSHTSD